MALQFLNGPSRSLTWPVRRVMSLIGSASGCKFRLTDPSVSRFHASLLRTPDGVWVVDLLGKDGITINEVPVRSGRLDHGDVVGIGRYQLRCQFRARRADSLDLGAVDQPLIGSLSKPNHGSLALNYPNWIATTLPGGNERTGNAGPQLPRPEQLSRGIEIISSESAVPFQLGQSSLAESVLVPLVNQFGLMQQQMFDQFQQTMAMMVQMFGAMHRDQMDVIRSEIDRLRELTDEIQALKTELASRSGESAEPAPSELQEQIHTITNVYGTESEIGYGAASRPSTSQSVTNDSDTAEVKPVPLTMTESPTISSQVHSPSASPDADRPDSPERQVPEFPARPQDVDSRRYSASQVLPPPSTAPRTPAPTDRVQEPDVASVPKPDVRNQRPDQSEKRWSGSTSEW